MTSSDVHVLASGAVNPQVLASFAWIMGAALLSPLISFATGKRIPATVLLIAFGVLIGPNVLGLASLDGGVGLIREIGLGMLFLLAGYEINPSDLRGKQARSGLSTWIICLVLCIGGAVVLLDSDSVSTAIVLAIAMTSTAVGTLMPIMRQQDMLNNNVGRSLMIHGAIGELAPVVAMALLLSTRATWLTISILIAFSAIAVLVALIPSIVRILAPWMGRAMADGAGSNNQTALRLVISILAVLMAVAAVFELDVVLGAFAAGFILRQLVPAERRETLEHLLDIVAFSLFIPVFFVASGMNIDPRAVTEHPWLTVLFVPLIYVTRGLPIFLREQAMDTDSGLVDWRERLQLSLYAATALPIIVAVTEVAVASRLLDRDIASVLVASGSMTVLLFPLLAYMIKSSEEVSTGNAEDGESDTSSNNTDHEVSHASQGNDCSPSLQLAGAAGQASADHGAPSQSSTTPTPTTGRAETTQQPAPKPSSASSGNDTVDSKNNYSNRDEETTGDVCEAGVEDEEKIVTPPKESSPHEEINDDMARLFEKPKPEKTTVDKTTPETDTPATEQPPHHS